MARESARAPGGAADEPAPAVTTPPAPHADPEALRDDVQQVVSTLSAQLGIEPAPTVHLTEDRRRFVACGVEVNRRANTLTVRTGTAELPADTLSAIIAHELARLRWTRAEFAQLVLWGLAAGLALIELGISGDDRGHLGRMFILAGGALIVALFIPMTVCRRLELRADVVSAHLTGPAGAGLSYGAGWPRTRLFRLLVLPFRLHAWPQSRIARYEWHAWRADCGCVRT